MEYTGYFFNVNNKKHNIFNILFYGIIIPFIIVLFFNNFSTIKHKKILIIFIIISPDQYAVVKADSSNHKVFPELRAE